jgi:hypothetical protein
VVTAGQNSLARPYSVSEESGRWVGRRAPRRQPAPALCIPVRTEVLWFLHLCIGKTVVVIALIATIHCPLPLCMVPQPAHCTHAHTHFSRRRAVKNPIPFTTIRLSCQRHSPTNPMVLPLVGWRGEVEDSLNISPTGSFGRATSIRCTETISCVSYSRRHPIFLAPRQPPAELIQYSPATSQPVADTAAC